MKPKNFPGRKNARRIQALKEVYNRAASKGSLNLWAEHRSNPYEEAHTLEGRIYSPAAARVIRSKKNRTGRAKIAR